MKKFSFILASLMLCFAVSMSSCSDKKGSANDSSASASDSTSTSGSASGNAGSAAVDGDITTEADLVAYLNSATEQIASASSVGDLKVVFEDIDVKMGDFAKANPGFQPTEETMVALSNAQNALQNKLNELGIDINALVNGGSEEVVAAATEYAQDGAEQFGEAVEAVEMPADIDF